VGGSLPLVTSPVHQRRPSGTRTRSTGLQPLQPEEARGLGLEGLAWTWLKLTRVGGLKLTRVGGRLEQNYFKGFR